MPDAVAPAASGGTHAEVPAFDPKAFGETLVGSFKTHLEQIVNPLKEEIAALKGSKTETAPAKSLTAEDVTNLLTKHDQARQASADAVKSRSDFITSDMKGIPAAYLAQLPATTDAAVLAAAGEKIRTAYRADLKAAGVELKEVAGAGATGAGGSPPGAMVDLSKLTPMQKIQLSISRNGSKSAAGKQA